MTNKKPRNFGFLVGKKKMKTLIYNGEVICDGTKSIDKGYILFDEKGIISIGDDTEFVDLLNNADSEKIDAKGLWITPGLTDIHNHGGIGYDFVSCNNDEVNEIAKSLILEGVTGFLASTTVDTVEEMAEMAKRLGSYSYQDGAMCLGIHMEGPYMSEKYRAVMREEYLRDADEDEYRNWQKLSNDFVKSITIAPERNGSLEFIKAVKDEVAIMIGHTDATVDVIHRAKEAGAKGFTHFYNAMSQHLHRTPGVVTGGFLEDELYCELICDGVHVDKDVARMTIKTMSPKRIVLITDAMPGKGMADGRFMFCKNWIIKENGATCIEGESRIAGSVMPLNEVCKNAFQWCGCSINDIVQMACVNPNELLKESEKGSLEIEKDADVGVFDEKMNPQYVFVNGVRKK